jgi:hypothetical protein
MIQESIIHEIIIPKAQNLQNHNPFNIHVMIQESIIHEINIELNIKMR